MRTTGRACIGLAACACVIASAVAGCGHDAAPAADKDAGPPGCSPGELPQDDGSCRAAGVPAERCEPGFVSDGAGGCVAVLPPSRCAKGAMAVPGETLCHEVAPCGDGDYGDVPVDAATQFVNQGYAGGGSDGSRSKPWTTVQAAVVAAKSHAIVAIAAGSYQGGVLIQARPVTLWGRCPAMVEIVGAGETRTVDVRSGADGTILRGFAIRGSGAVALGLSGSEGVVAQELWIHDFAGRGVDVERALGPTALTIRDSLVEATTAALFLAGSKMDVEKSVLRDTVPVVNKDGRGIEVEPDPNAPGKRASLTVTGSLIERCSDEAIFVAASDATITATLVRDTAANGGKLHGHGVGAQDDVARSSVTVRGCVIERSHEAGIFIGGSDLTVDASVVRDTQPQVLDGTAGRGIHIEENETTGVRPTATVSATLIDGNRHAGIHASAGDLTLESVIVRGTRVQQSDGRGGRGINAQSNKAGTILSTASIRGCQVLDNDEMGISVVGASATIESTLVDGTRARPDGNLGDGIALIAEASPATATVRASTVRNSARAGLSNFGGQASIEANAFSCNTFDLDGEPLDGADFSFEVLGGNTCGCDADGGTCQVLSASIQAPEPIQTGK